ncbi:hypothetical protein G5V59_13795 [Nocardioides sp. W3-2-3]|uniref:hypothetical protein n=1 Tax=Nocardioides convexus TaxID=2712224 RepID=UPI0024189F36|nr:hypothetical protein [Nocardioides convexus]NHA00719.1 hypothetical protein [Nocardioides convexus]
MSGEEQYLDLAAAALRHDVAAQRTISAGAGNGTLSPLLVRGSGGTAAVADRLLAQRYDEEPGRLPRRGPHRQRRALRQRRRAVRRPRRADGAAPCPRCRARRGAPALAEPARRRLERAPGHPRPAGPALVGGPRHRRRRRAARGAR